MSQQLVGPQDGLSNYIFDTSKYQPISIPTYDEKWKQYSMIKDYLNAYGCSNVAQMSQCMTHDVMTSQSQSPASQVFNELYHRSECPSFDQFLNDKAMSQLRQDHHKLFTLYQQYSSVYNKDICLPLPQYFLCKQQRFEGDEANKIMAQVGEILKSCKLHRNPAHAGVKHFDAIFKLELSQENADTFPECGDSDSDDDDDEYADIKKAHAPVAPPKRVIPEIDQKLYAKKQLRDGLHGIESIMRKQLKQETEEQYNYYSRYEMKFIGDSMHTLTATDTVPRLSPDNTRLFREYHTITAIKRAAVTMGNLLCFSYHVLQSCIQLFCYIHVNGQIYGQRVFSKDLLPLFNSLYPGSKIESPTMQVSKMEINENIEMDTDKNLTFDDDEMYIEIMESRPETKSLIETIESNMQNEYNVKIASKVITAIQEDGYDDDSLWDDIQEEDESLLKERMELNQFKSVLTICRQYHDQSSVINKVVLFKKRKCEQFERQDVKTKICIEYPQSNIKNKQEQIPTQPREFAEVEAFGPDPSPLDTDTKIKISKEFKIQPLTERIKEEFVNVDNLYHYIDISTSLQIKDGQMKEISFADRHQKHISIINYDLHSKDDENKSLYGIPIKSDNQWILDAFMTTDEIVKRFNINPESLPKSSRQSLAFERKKIKPMITENVFQTNWSNLEHNYGFLPPSDIPLSTNTFKICQHRLIEQCKKSLRDGKLPQFRIIVQDDNNYWIEWIKVIRVEYSSSFTFYTAIQYAYDPKQQLMISEGLNDEPPEELPYELQVIIIEFCVPIKVKAIHHDPRYIYSLHTAVGDESDLSLGQLLSLSPWPIQFEIGDFKSELETFVEILNSDTGRTNIDMSLIRTRISEQTIDFNYSYFLFNPFRVFRQTFPEFRIGRLRRMFWKLRGKRAIMNVDKEQVDFAFDWNVEPDIRYHALESLFDAYIRVAILNNLPDSVELIPMDVIDLCKRFYTLDNGDYFYISS